MRCIMHYDVACVNIIFPELNKKNNFLIKFIVLAENNRLKFRLKEKVRILQCIVILY